MISIRKRWSRLRARFRTPMIRRKAAASPPLPHAAKLCYDKLPDLQVLDDNQQVRCWKYTDQWEPESEVNVLS